MVSFKMSTEFSLKQLSELVDISERKIRYYIQRDLVDSPVGARKTAKYTQDHLEQILTIQKWQMAGLSLDRIQAILHHDESVQLPPEPSPEPGSVNMVSKIYITEGVQLEVDMLKTQLTNSQLRVLTKQILSTLKELDEDE